MQEHQGGLAGGDAQIVGLDEYGLALRLQGRGVGPGTAGRRNAVRGRARADRRLYDDLALGDDGRSPGAKNGLGTMGTPAAAKSVR